jgi:hypothetical protein
MFKQGMFLLDERPLPVISDASLSKSFAEQHLEALRDQALVRDQSDISDFPRFWTVGY